VSLVHLESVSFSYGRQLVLKNIEFDVEDGEFTAIIGPNGGGKSTLLKLILGILEPDRGRIEVMGKTPLQARGEIGYVPQNTNVNLEFPITVLDVVMMGNRRKHRPSSLGLWDIFPIRYNDIEKKCAYTTLEKVGMHRYMKKRIGELSGGERQRVMIARALCSHPKLLILDEPTSSIDMDGQKLIYSLLEELSGELTILVVSHDLSVITEYADKVIYINTESYVHNLDENPINMPIGDGHFCEVEMMQMLGEKR
jgi:zinc transport system ATP-binding protein